MSTKTEATVQDLYRVPENGKAELIDGELHAMAPTGFLPNRASSKIWLKLYEYEQHAGGGYAIADNAGFVVNLPHRKSFSPDAAFYIGQPSGGKFLNGAPAFAVEVRSEGDYGAAAEKALAAKRVDYFAAGTLVVWDVDVLKQEFIKSYRADDPDQPRVFRRGETATAELAVPGWSMAVSELFE
jgi:Uma2 family endonuclease